MKHDISTSVISIAKTAQRGAREENILFNKNAIFKLSTFKIKLSQSSQLVHPINDPQQDFFDQHNVSDMLSASVVLKEQHLVTKL